MIKRNKGTLFPNQWSVNGKQEDPMICLTNTLTMWPKKNNIL